MSTHHDEQESLQFGFGKAARNVTVGLHRVFASRKLPLNDDYADGVVYGNKPLVGRSRFEVKIITCCKKFGTLKIGIARHEPRRAYAIPRISETADGHLVWLGDGLYGDTQLLPCKAVKYSLVDLHELTPESLIRFDIQSDGTLSFFVNGKSQGVAAHNVYQEGLEVRPVVDLFGGCRVVITQALTNMHVSLQDRCMEVVADNLQARSDVEALPLPRKFKSKLQDQVPIKRMILPDASQKKTKNKLHRFFSRKRKE